MRKVISKSILLIALALIAFVGCEKETKTQNEEVQTENDASILKSQEDDARIAYYRQLSAETNVDIIELASSNAVEQFFDIGISVAEEMIENSVTGLTEYDIWMIEFYTSLLEEAIEEGNFLLIEQRTNELLELLESLGLTNYWNIAVASNDNPVMDRLNDESRVFLKYLESEYPDFMTLDQDQQSEIFEALSEIYISRQPANECEREAGIMLGLSLTGATVGLTAGLLKCAFVGPIASLCIASNFAIYAIDVSYAIWQYNSAIKWC